MPQLELTLPSGAKGRVRGLKGREINLFANRSAARRNKTAQQILSNVWIETVEGGELYGDEIDWKAAPQCDRFTALFKARIATFGPDYTFKHKCGDCGKRYEWTENLEQRPVKPLPQESIEAFKNGNRFHTEVTDPEGTVRRVAFQLLTQKLEDKVQQVQSLAPKEKATASLAQRIVSVEGLDSGKGPIKRFLEDLDAGAFFDLIEAMDEVDGGIETEIEVECPHCGEVEDLEIPLEEEFWAPQRRKRSSTSTET
jgi:endogenous inhibitor of DNA gyrase (YacG/DUF329 family)